MIGHNGRTGRQGSGGPSRTLVTAASRARTKSGEIEFPMEAPIGTGGRGMYANPIPYLVGSLGGCVGVKILLALSDNGIVPEEMTIGIRRTWKKTLPAFFDQIPLTVTLRAAGADDAMVSDIVDETLIRPCPVTVRFADFWEVTAEHRIVRPG